MRVAIMPFLLQELVVYLKHFTPCVFRGVTQFGRVLGLGPRCRRFESCRLDQ